MHFTKLLSIRNKISFSYIRNLYWNCKSPSISNIQKNNTTAQICLKSLSKCSYTICDITACLRSLDPFYMETHNIK